LGIATKARTARLCGVLALCVAALVCPAQKSQPDPGEPVFRSQSHLVLLPFRVTRGKNYVTGLTQADVVLLQDGKPRPFTIFDTPGSGARLPVELVLLFDVTPRIQNLWDPDDVFRFIPQWNDKLSDEILGQSHSQIDIRISVYKSIGRMLYRSAPPTADPHVLTKALRSVLQPVPAPPDPADVTVLRLPPYRDRVNRGPFTDNYVTSYFIGAEGRGLTMEAAIGLLNQVSAAEDPVARVLVMFSEGIGASSTIPDDIGNQALDLGIPVYPVATNYQNHIQEADYPRNFFRMRQFEALGRMTGGRAAECNVVDAGVLTGLLDIVAKDVQAQYVVGFVPAAEGKGHWHRLEVRLSSKSSGALQGGKRRAFYQ